MMRLCLFLALCLCFFSSPAQDNYEIQVYGSETMLKGATMLELHSNYTFGGQLYMQDGVLPTHNIDHETIEITHGFTSWFETGFYFFNAIGSYGRTSYVGSHIRPRVMVPASWQWPVGVSLSTEIGYQKPQYSTDDWTWEIRPIIDKTWKRVYLAFNPAFERSLHGLNQSKGFSFSPNFKASYSIVKAVATGIEYYGSFGPAFVFDTYQQQQHQLFLAIDLDWNPNWEFNAGYGLGFTNSTDNDIFKMILGYRFHRKVRAKSTP